MIITKEKNIDEVVTMLGDASNALIIGCDGCNQPVRALKPAKQEGLIIQLKKKLANKKFTYRASSIFRQCDENIVATTLRALMEDKNYDAIISMACGVGVQVVGKVIDGKIPVIPGQNTLFLGAKMANDVYEELCGACGDCLLGYTGAVCPVANCAKGLMNGPCGGQIDGKCEVGNYKNPCAWIMIYERLKNLPGGVEAFRRYRPPRDYRLQTGPRYYDINQEEEATENE